MSVETFSMAEIVSVTPEAALHFANQLEKTGKQGIRITLEESGCTGFKYVIDEVEAPTDGDIQVELENHVRLFIDSSRVSELRGTEVDLQQQGINKSLVLNNPNVKDACGCGESFSFS